jgi:hypothetical protein
VRAVPQRQKDPRKVFIGGKWAVGTPGMECLSEGIHSNTHTIDETPRSRAHKKAEISRLKNNFGCLRKLVSSLPRFKQPFNTPTDEAVVNRG